jgi:hypothetical protein
MPGRNWKRVAPTTLSNAIELCIEFAKEKHNRSVDRIAELIGLANKYTLYKWIESGKLPAISIRPFEHACGCDFVTRYLAHSAHKLLIDIPSAARPARKICCAYLRRATQPWACSSSSTRAKVTRFAPSRRCSWSRWRPRLASPERPEVAATRAGAGPSMTRDVLNSELSPEARASSTRTTASSASSRCCSRSPDTRSRAWRLASSRRVFTSRRADHARPGEPAPRRPRRGARRHGALAAHAEARADRRRDDARRRGSREEARRDPHRYTRAPR